MLRPSVLTVALLLCFSTTIFAAASSEGEISIKFSEAQNLAAQGKIKQAISAYQFLIHSNPQLPEAYNNLAALYLKQEKIKQAKFTLEQGLNAHRGYGALYENLTSINVAMARNAYSKALQIDLEPADIAIATLSLSDNNAKNVKNTLVTSMVDTAVLERKAAVKIQPATTTRPAAEIKRVTVSPKLPLAPIKQFNRPESVETFLQAWSAAWSAQAVDIYLSFYLQKYRPAKGLSRKDWERLRHRRLIKPDWIKVVLSDVNIEKNDGQQAIVTFKQSYQSNTYSDVSSKRMVLLYTASGWRIFQEKSI